MEEIQAAIDTALQAGEIIRNAWQGDRPQIFDKDTPINPVTEIDRRCEELIKTRLRAAFRNHGILSEESDEESSNDHCRWIIDPLDGTSNFIRRYPFVAVSIALEVKGRLELGVVYNPILEELYVGHTGAGATRNQVPLHVSETGELGSAMLASGFPYDAWHNPHNNTDEWARFIRQTRTLRCDGSAALDLCHVASGQLDGYWEKGIYPWDMAAGIVIAREAGAVVSDYDGLDDFLVKEQIVAANPRLHPLMLKEIKQVAHFQT